MIEVRGVHNPGYIKNFYRIVSIRSLIIINPLRKVVSAFDIIKVPFQKHTLHLTRRKL